MRQDEHEQAAGADARHRLRQVDPHGTPSNGVRPERRRRAHVVRRDAAHHAVERQHHERQQDVGHRDIDADPVVDQRSGSLTGPAPSAPGCLMVFIEALGYYITPALVGGADDQMISYFIAFYASRTVNWGMAAALSIMLLAATLALYAVYNRMIGLEKLRMT